MAGGTLVWSVPPEALAARVRRLQGRFTDAVDRLSEETAADGEARAKVDAPWQNRTGAARAGLQGTSNVQGGSGTIVLAHGVSYGIWLELANQARYGILPATLDYMVGQLEDGLDGLLERVA